MDARVKLRRLLDKATIAGTTFNPTPLQVARAYNILNHSIFAGKLKKPDIMIRNLNDAWGLCEGDIYTGKDRWIHNPICHRIVINNEFPTFKFFIEVLAHEMVHQYQCDFQNKMDHGKTFWAWENKLKKYNLKLFKSKAAS